MYEIFRHYIFVIAAIMGRFLNFVSTTNVFCLITVMLRKLSINFFRLFYNFSILLPLLDPCGARVGVLV